MFTLRQTLMLHGKPVQMGGNTEGFAWIATSG
jgi:hypothetical protein